MSHIKPAKKIAVVENLLKDNSLHVRDMAKELGLEPSTLYYWIRRYKDHGPKAFEKTRRGARYKSTKSTNIVPETRDEWTCLIIGALVITSTYTISEVAEKYKVSPRKVQWCAHQLSTKGILIFKDDNKPTESKKDRSYPTAYLLVFLVVGVVLGIIIKILIN